MNYKETVHWMFQQLPMYQNQGATAYRDNLDNAILLAKHLGNPEKTLKCIHVAGTNGKGSTSHMLASILQEAGYRVGLYTSPHLKDFRERIKINGEEISESFVSSFISDHRKFFEEHHFSFFEMSVGMAFEYFKKEHVGVAVIEVGMGGRLDATNIITPLISVITNIGLDHMQFLGSTLPSIAAEKAGIIKHEVPVVIGQYVNETRAVFEKKSSENSAPIYYASDIITEEFDSALQGNYQVHNKKTALQTIRVLQKTGHFTITEQHIASGFRNVLVNTGLQGRWQQLQTNPLVICDTAHNPDGLTIVMKQIQSQQYRKLHMVLGMVNDKDLTGILPLFPVGAQYYFCTPNLPRGLDAKILQEKAKDYQLNGLAYPSVSAAYHAAISNAGPDDLIFVGGSTFVVAEIL